MVHIFGIYGIASVCFCSGGYHKILYRSITARSACNLFPTSSNTFSAMSCIFSTTPNIYPTSPKTNYIGIKLEPDADTSTVFIPFLFSNASISASFPRKRLYKISGSSVPPFDKTFSRKERAVSWLKIPVSLKREKASASKTSAHL